jgi:hypothetical protein
MTLIEKAGAALYDRWTRQSDVMREAAMNGPHPAWERLEQGSRAKWCDDARTVLEAAREPSPEMIKAGEAWQAHTSDVDSLFAEMIKIAIHGPE